MNIWVVMSLLGAILGLVAAFYSLAAYRKQRVRIDAGDADADTDAFDRSGLVQTYSAQQIYGFARAAGFSPDQAVTMTAIALAESGGNTRARNPHGEDSRGLWQVNMNAHAAEFAGQDLYDPLANARAAFRISRGGHDISPWTTTHGGSHASYVQFRHDAQAAAVAYGDDRIY